MLDVEGLAMLHQIVWSCHLISDTCIVAADLPQGSTKPYPNVTFPTQVLMVDSSRSYFRLTLQFTCEAEAEPKVGSAAVAQFGGSCSER